jgi:hypothetical protein
MENLVLWLCSRKQLCLQAQNDQKKTEPKLWNIYWYIINNFQLTKIISCEIMHFTVLGNLRKQISLLCLHSTLKIYQNKYVFRFILDILYKARTDFLISCVLIEGTLQYVDIFTRTAVSWNFFYNWISMITQEAVTVTLFFLDSSHNILSRVC